MNAQLPSSSEHARAAALARWAKKKSANLQPSDGQPAPVEAPATIRLPEPSLPEPDMPAPEAAPEHPEVAHSGIVQIGRYKVSDQCADNILNHLWAYVFPYRPA